MINWIAVATHLRRWRWLLVAVPLVSALLGGLVSQPDSGPVFEANAVVRIGKVWELEPAGAVNEFVEPAQSVVERLGLRVIQDDILTKSDLKLDSSEADLFRNSLKVRAVPATDLVEIRVQATNGALATRLIEKAVEVAVGAHAALQNSSIARHERQLENLERYLESLKGFRTQLLQLTMPDSNDAATGSISRALSLMGLQQVERELLSASDKQLLLRQMSDTMNQRTGLLTAPLVSERKPAPRLVAKVAASAMLGLILALFVVMLTIPQGSDRKESDN